MANLTEMDVLLHGCFGKGFPTVHVSNHKILVHSNQTRFQHRSFTVSMQWRPHSTPRTIFEVDALDVVYRKPGSNKRTPAAATGSSRTILWRVLNRQSFHPFDL
ncbi:hypothetical protein AVEN_6210-1 [Araneus ventricosus]|uniref:Uncharacterized protein n=1 Tax=Araneus ventricosus TaxID=182803 RepID=A0A4Y2NGU1_ARAVE|nr:hypothetical protein AVEN_6210-1 [Araneus ventricosus]